MERLVFRLGRTQFAALSSFAWALPMAAWAGSVDLYPGPAPWIAFAIGVVMLVAWIGLLARLRGLPVEERPRRFDLRQMSRAERAWNSLLAAAMIGIVGWLNAAATVDWALLAPGLRAGRTAPVVFLSLLLALLLVLAAVAVTAWRRAGRHYRTRR